MSSKNCLTSSFNRNLLHVHQKFVRFIHTHEIVVFISNSSTITIRMTYQCKSTVCLSDVTDSGIWLDFQDSICFGWVHFWVKTRTLFNWNYVLAHRCRGKLKLMLCILNTAFTLQMFLCNCFGYHFLVTLEIITHWRWYTCLYLLPFFHLNI